MENAEYKQYYTLPTWLCTHILLIYEGNSSEPNVSFVMGQSLIPSFEYQMISTTTFLKRKQYCFDVVFLKVFWLILEYSTPLHSAFVLSFTDAEADEIDLEHILEQLYNYPKICQFLQMICDISSSPKEVVSDTLQSQRAVGGIVALCMWFFSYLCWYEVREHF